jgi:tetratricopeptide (TPR) repeat protein
VFRALLRFGRYDDAGAVVSTWPGADGSLQDCLRIEILVDQRKAAEAEALRASCTATASDETSIAIAMLDALVGDALGAAGGAAELGVSSHALASLARARSAEGKHEEARDLLERALALEPWNASVQCQLAVAYMRTNQRAKAYAQMSTLFEAETWVSRWESGALSGVLTKGQELGLEVQLRSSLALLVVCLLEDGDTERAAVALRKAEARFGRVREFAAPGVRLLVAQEGVAAGWPAVERALSSFPGDALLLDQVGRMAYADATGLPATLAELVAQQGSDADRHNVLAGYGRARMPAECVRFGLRVPDVSFVQDDLAAVMYGCALESNDLKTAAIVEERARALVPDGARIWHARLLMEEGREVEALALLERVKPAAGGLADARVTALLRLDRVDEALSAAKGAQLDPVTRYNLGVSLYNLSRTAEVASVLKGFDCASVPAEVADDCASMTAAAGR